MTDTVQLTTAADLTAILRRHYLPAGRPAGGVFASEIGSPDGRRRADALWMPLTTSGGTGLIGHEIKVTRADVMVELQDPTKAEPWLQFCERWWLVIADPALVEGLEIPEAWGIMSPPSGRRTRSMTIVRPAPKLHPKNPAPGLQRLLAWSFYRQSTALGEAERDRDRYQRLWDDARERLAQRQIGADTPHAARVHDLLKKIEEAADAREIWHRVDDGLIAETVVDAMVVREATKRAARQLEGVAQSLEDPFGYAKRQVDAALRLLAAGSSPNAEGGAS
ncbi:hypothetical protein [Nocardioides aquiterrae]|uniref:MmcB family DNA repair protein n=1 Tax=Nocardioides aquiterrae TaxID=203799 RepID=A0ABN1UDK7_9ACTN